MPPRSLSLLVVTVTVCGLFQVVGLKVTLFVETAVSWPSGPGTGTVTVTFTVPAGLLARVILYSPVLPSLRCRDLGLSVMPSSESRTVTITSGTVSVS